MSNTQASPTFKVGLTPDEKKLYAQLFKSLDPENTGIITGEKSRSTFESSGLPPAILGEIWQIADQDNLGFLNQFGFCYAMRLIGYTQAGHHPTAGLADVPGPLPKFANLTLQPQSTSSSFLSNQPSSTTVPQHVSVPAVASPPVGSLVTPLNATDYQKFSQLFIRTVGSSQGELTGEQARDILLKAKLPTPVLGQIWTLVDRYNIGRLNIGSFAIAMHLIQGLLSGSIKQLPPFLPDSVWQSVEQQSDNQGQARQVSHSSINSQSTAIRHPPPSPTARTVSTATTNNEWAVSPAMKQQYQSIFNNLDKEKTGSLNPDQVASFLMTSKLSQQDLATVWDLSDIQNSGIFTVLEFSIALFLIHRKLAGGQLPNIVPDALLESLQASSQPTESEPKSQISPLPTSQPNLTVQNPQIPKSSMDDLVDIFGSPTSAGPKSITPSVASPVPAVPPTVPQPTLQQRASSGDLSRELPKARPNFTGSFKPTSNFGQTLLKHAGDEHDDENLLKDEKPRELSPALAPPQPVVQEAEQKAVNYDALRNVPPPPQKRTSTIPSTPPPALPAASVPLSANRSGSQQNFAGNDDLLADPAISGQMSQATSDIANFSNQIKSLASQTSNLHEKKIRAEQELQRILNTKSDIENKLKQLRVSYDNEVKQVEQVESNLTTAKEETEALRSEASIAEAKLNSLSGELNNKQVAMEELQKENASLKERLASFNVEIAELEKESAAKLSETQSLSNQVAVKKSQVQVSIVKCEELKTHITETEESHKQLQLELDNAERERLANEREQQELLERSAELEKSKPTTASPGIASAVTATAGAVGVGAIAGAAIGGIAGVLHHEDDKEDAKEVTEDEPPVEKEGEQTDEDINKRYPELSPQDNRTNVTSSITTDNADENETPITSPSNSDFQFPQAGNPGIAGGMVGMPGVLVGVQRTDSLTSSVQNNAALSVRDDNIDEISDRETLEDIGDAEESAPNTADAENFDTERHGEGSDKGSSGHESFELVNSEEARGHSEEFPPIKELDYQESDSSDEEEEQNYDDAVDKLTSPVPVPSIAAAPASASPVHASPAPAETLKAPHFDDFDSAFDNLQPATPEVNKEDAFTNAFDDLEAAQVDNEEVEDFGTEDFGGLSNEFTNSNAPDFSSANSEGQVEGNDEWEQLFAGFGNANVAAEETHPQAATEDGVQLSPTGDQANSFAIQELIGMGFDEKTATEALKKENWNLEAATNYLLDNA
ncbi:EH domain-containing and endocytosis protein 1 [Spathaspora sp. JA1]|nr:EH domain-containing and endocytosis protein 1 [Spathaspora sp. JA1]